MMSLDPLIRLMSHNRFFAGFPQEMLRLLAFSSEHKTIPARTLLYSAGDSADSAYFIVDGLIRLTPGEHITDVTPHDVGGGVLLDRVALIIETKRPVKAKTEQETKVLRMSRSLFSRLIREFPEARQNVARQLKMDVQNNLDSLQGVLDNFERYNLSPVTNRAN